MCRGRRRSHPTPRVRLLDRSTTMAILRSQVERRAYLGTALSGWPRILLGGRDPDPTRSRDHVVLSIFAERRLRAGTPADVGSLLADVRDPPMETVGAMSFDDFLPRRERTALATALNTLLASPTFESWRQGGPLDIEQWARSDRRRANSRGHRERRASRRRRTLARRRRCTRSVARGGGTRRARQDDHAALVRDAHVHREPAVALVQWRTTMCWLRGPMTRADLKRLRTQRERVAGEPEQSPAIPATAT